ncbi:MAG: PilZ domain-containing protein [Candidatus Omnitrophica bacterium]|nr:PilZ domain-containing protein [Candidatus Omnitrophota bacterium]
MLNNNNNYSDRRIFERVPLDLSVRFIDTYHLCEGEGKTVDISAKGMGLVTEHNLNPYTPLELWVDIPGRNQPFYTRAEVVWSKPLAENLWRVGVEFERADFMNVSQLLNIK